MKIKSEKQGWWIYHNKAISPIVHWERPKPDQLGLLLRECPTCHTKQTRQTYLNGFSHNFYTLIQDYSITGIEQCCNCDQWLQVHD